MNGAPDFGLVKRDSSEAARIDEADFAGVGQCEDGVSMRRERDFGGGDEQAAGHAEVDEEFGRVFVPVNRHYDGLANAADGFDASAGEGAGDFVFGRLEGLRLAAGPDAKDARAVDTGVDACSDGLDLGKLGHRDRVMRPAARMTARTNNRRSRFRFATE